MPKGLQGFQKEHSQSEKWKETMKGNNFGTINKGKKKTPFTKEHRRNIGKANLGKKQTEESNKKRSETMKGKPNSGQFKKGYVPSNKGKKRGPQSEEWKKKGSDSRKGKKHSKEWNNNIGKANKGRTTWIKGKTYTEIGRPVLTGEKHWNWQGGISNKGYPIDWTEILRESIRQRDNYICFICEIHQDELERKLAVHHKDYNKENLDPNNLISLCTRCHVKTNYNKEYWIEYFKSRSNK